MGSGGFLPGSLFSAKATMWIPFKSSSCGRKESRVTLEGVRDGLRVWNGNGRWGRGVADRGWTQRHRGTQQAHVKGGNTNEAWEEIVAFDKCVCQRGKRQLQKDIGPERASPPWSRVQESSRGRQRRKRVRLAHQELCGHQALGIAQWMRCRPEFRKFTTSECESAMHQIMQTSRCC